MKAVGLDGGVVRAADGGDAAVGLFELVDIDGADEENRWAALDHGCCWGGAGSFRLAV